MDRVLEKYWTHSVRKYKCDFSTNTFQNECSQPTDSFGQFLICAWQIQNENGEKSKLKNAEIWTDKLVVANWQTGGGTKSALAFNWIDLRKCCQGKSLSWHPAEFKKVCKYGAAMHIEGARSLWRKITRSGGLRSSNWLSSQLENLTKSYPSQLEAVYNHSLIINL